MLRLNLFLPICRARDQTPKRRRTILPSVKATSKIDIKRLYDHLIHNVVEKNIITTTTTLFNRVFHVLNRNKKRNLPSPSLGVSLNRSEKDLVLMLGEFCFLCSEQKKSVFLKYPTVHLDRETNKYERRIYDY